MEVQKHPHHVTHKKKWTEYLLEFFMLFLAVFLGFLAENFRENIIEKERGSQYMHTMVENLKYDTARCMNTLKVNIDVAKGIDSLRFQIKEAIDGKMNSNRLYYNYLQYARIYGTAAFNKAAITQLQSSGNLRLVKNDKLANEILDYYDRRLHAVESAHDNLINKSQDLGQVCKGFFNWQYFEEWLTRDTVFTTAFIPGNDPFSRNYYENVLNREPPLKLLTTSREALEKLYNEVAVFELALRKYNSFLRYAKVGADTLREHILKAYDFKDE
jgi:hypothetical protein